MPITVSCPACSSRFSLSDDLYRRRVAGSLVKVKCRYCKAEIAVDATEAMTMPSEEAPRKHPIPPRPKAITQLGLGTPPAPAELATTSPLPLDLTHSGLPLNATVTPLPINAATITSHAMADADMSWNDEPTLAINLANVKPPPKPPVVRTAPMVAAEEPELIEAEEVPPSSSGAPTLDALTLEAGGAHVPHGKPAPDEFLVSLSSGGNGMLGAPTIDVTSFAAEIPPTPTSVDVVLEGDEELEYRPARSNTMPLFDMGAVLPPAGQDGSADRADPNPVAPLASIAEPPTSEGRARERKYVIAPEAEAAKAAPKARRARPMLWVGLLAASGAAGVAVGLYERQSTQLAMSEPTQVALPARAPVVNTEAALPAEVPAVETSETANTPTASAIAPAAPPAPPAQNVAVGTNRSLTANTTAALKSSTNAAVSSTEPTSSLTEPAAEKPAATVKQFEAHNAPPPAAPDTEFDRAAARNALASAAAQASSCRKQGDPSGTANLTITFAPSGRVTSAQIQGPPFSGTPTGGCIASTMRRANVPAFSGDYVTVSKTIVVQ
jgi:hypothetical protein